MQKLMNGWIIQPIRTVFELNSKKSVSVCIHTNTHTYVCMSVYICVCIKKAVEMQNCEASTCGKSL